MSEIFQIRLDTEGDKHRVTNGRSISKIASERKLSAMNVSVEDTLPRSFQYIIFTASQHILFVEE